MIPLDPIDDFITGLPHPVERAVPKPSVSAQCLQRMYDDKKFRTDMAIGARETAEKMSWEVTIPRWSQIFDELLNPVVSNAPVVPSKINTFKI